MAKAEKFEDLIAWQRSPELAKEIYQLTNSGEFSRDFGFRDQIRRASVSVMSNIAEGFERASRPDFHRFLVIAKASCAEVRSQLYLALDIGYISETEFKETMQLATETAKIIGGLRRSVDQKTHNSAICKLILYREIARIHKVGDRRRIVTKQLSTHCSVLSTFDCLCSEFLGVNKT